jgi:hypothetical protein
MTPLYHCQKCGRRMKGPGIEGFGPVCARAAFGTKPKRVKAEPVRRDSLTPDLFEGVAA